MSSYRTRRVQFCRWIKHSVLRIPPHICGPEWLDKLYHALHPLQTLGEKHALAIYEWDRFAVRFRWNGVTYVVPDEDVKEFLYKYRK